MSNGPTRFDSVDDAIAAVGAGELVVVVDDDDRENEGDLIMAASRATPEQVAFMIRHTSGILCAPLTVDDAKRLHLEPMVARNDAPLATAFTVSVDYRHGLSTGISAEERANSALALANSNAAADDFVRPGHIFPLVGRVGGVLVRSGHTEAAIDLATAAGCPPVGLLAEIVNDDGSVKRLPELMKFAREHGLKIISIADLIAFRQRREVLVERTHEFRVQTPIGWARAYAYRTKFEDAEHLALVFGHLDPGSSVPVRIHRERLVEDIFGPQSNHESRLLDLSLRRIDDLGGGVMIYLRTGFVGVPHGSLDDAASVTRESERKAEWLEIGVGAQILKNLGLTSIRILAGRQIEYVGLEGFGLRVDGTELLVDAPGVGDA
ncbi:MAG: 3,4-dihydroxy-2-butanone-4-phosphate synthase [Gammaproteobacteria bacterium]|nr:3,4-dihydroxy-2-butanone-4-phosphate synthase [Gammaproteobacteria bacterium]MDE0451812.1 3,4-dihydroxy-2-butanone-4-phosphate synthase [Gammaproteobacteria bacterium]